MWQCLSENRSSEHSSEWAVELPYINRICMYHSLREVLKIVPRILRFQIIGMNFFTCFASDQMFPSKDQKHNSFRDEKRKDTKFYISAKNS